MLERRWGWLRVPVLIDRREDIEYSKDIGNHKVDVPKRKVSPRTDPRLSMLTVL